MVDYGLKDKVAIITGANNPYHIEKFEKEIASAGIETDKVSPKLLLDYTRKN